MKNLFIGVFAVAVGCALALQFPATAIAKSQETVLHSFSGDPDGAFPRTGLIDVKGTLYGTTSGQGGGTRCAYGCGTVFALDPGSGAVTALYSFCNEQGCEDGEYPEGLLIDMGDKLYGTTVKGGAHDGGTVYAVDRKSGRERVLYAFCSQQIGYRKCADGAYPQAGLIYLNGELYGTTSEGGAFSNSGTAFALDPTTGAETVLHSFGDSDSDGYDPAAGLINVNGMLYGTTKHGGGAYGEGTVYSLDPSTGTETVLHSFGGAADADGSGPAAGLVYLNGTLYGTTIWGGTGDCFPHSTFRHMAGCGTVFALDPSSGAETVVYSFCSHHGCKDGAYPKSSLIAKRGMLYGTTENGGTRGSCGHGCGTAFTVNPSTGAQKVLYAFCPQQNCGDGSWPEAGLIDVKGTLYGTTFKGGADGLGTVFALTKQ
ncbi:MAG TPA: choice-of-anchor tandem repeat GloVer-containing protein [Rhizomicrobium sp.]|nr:choice-of-anchor tandem repeat GloVer-containing protein [Rhizomicrobium sp.]